MIRLTKLAIKKYDRSIVVIITALGVFSTIYFTIQKNIDLIIRSTSIIKELQEINAVQKEINRTFENSLDKIDKKLDKILDKDFK